jgi:hypothetical protein
MKMSQKEYRIRRQQITEPRAIARDNHAVQKKRARQMPGSLTLFLN